MIKSISTVTQAIARTRALQSPQAPVHASKRDPFGKPWMTTVALLAVNVSLVAVLISSAPKAQAQQIPSLPVCNWCYERWVGDKAWHRTKGGVFWRRMEGMAIHHQNDGAYPYSCRTAHPWAACCDPSKG